jgi:hypothetical protein
MTAAAIVNPTFTNAPVTNACTVSWNNASSVCYMKVKVCFFLLTHPNDQIDIPNVTFNPIITLCRIILPKH